MRVLVDLAQLGTLRAVAASTGYSTSAVSQQLARLQAELGAPLVEPVGRRLVLTPAGIAFLPHARAALAALDAGRGELGGEGPLRGLVRVAGYATSVLRDIAPATRRLRERHPGLEVHIQEREPDEIRTLLAEDAIDVGVVYDHSLTPHPGLGEPFAVAPLQLAVHARERRAAPAIIGDPDTVWIANSRAADEDEIIRRLTASSDVVPRIHHHIDSIRLVTQLVADGHGAALIADDTERHPAVRYVELDGLAGTRRSYTVTRPGRERWRLAAAVIDELRAPLGTPAASAVSGRAATPSAAGAPTDSRPARSR